MDQDLQFSKQGWVSLKEHLESRMAAMEKAVTIAQDSMNERLLSMNEFRASLRDQNAMFITQPEHRALCDLVDRYEQRIRDLEMSKERLAGMASQSSVTNAQIYAFIGIALGIISTIISLIKFL